MSEILFRQLEPDDLRRVAPVRRRALATLAGQGEAPEWSRSDVAPELTHVVRTDPDLAWIAEIHGRPVGYALGAVRDGLCTVSHLFVEPDVHARDIGQKLLRRLVEATEARGASRRWVVASSSHAARALYLRAGLYDRATLYTLQGPIRALLALPEPLAAARLRPAALCGAWLDRLSALDRAVRGAARSEDHAFFLHSLDARGEALVSESGEMLGYVYYWTHGQIGPMAATRSELQLDLLRIAGQGLSASGVDAVWLHVPSLNEVVLSTLIERRFVIRGLHALMASGSWGALDRYLPSGGVLM